MMILKTIRKSTDTPNDDNNCSNTNIKSQLKLNSFENERILFYQYDYNFIQLHFIALKLSFKSPVAIHEDKIILSGYW